MNKKLIVFLILLFFIEEIFTYNINDKINNESNKKTANISTNTIQKTQGDNYIKFDPKVCSIINESILDLKFIYNITENLSNIIFTEYNESNGEIAKGREFGTKGEQKAADIIFDNMTKLGLYTWKEPINNSPLTLSKIPKIASKVEIIQKGFTVENIKKGIVTPISECYFSSRWNLTGISTYPEIEKLISLIFPANGLIDEKYNFYDEARLTNNFSYTNLRVIPKPYCYSLPTLLLHNIIYKEPFVYIAKDNSYSEWSIPKLKFVGPIFNKTFQNIPKNEMVLWSIFQPNCKGLILVDSNNDSFNNNPALYDPLPKIYINGTLGKKILDNPEDYRINFYINQQWNETVESYNIIGQINGTDTNKTVIVTCLYDCQWNQGTGDSAIGMAIVLGLAKYIKNQNITPKCNVRFIGFCGEEHGLRGAYYYESLHRKENISLVIDLNQLGFKWTKTRLTLAIYTNNESLNYTISTIANTSNYVDRTGNVTNFVTLVSADGGPLSNARVFADAKKLINQSYNTILIVKKGPWYFHHRDGMNHQEGDVIKYFDWLDTRITSEMIWNVTKYFTFNFSN